MPSDLRPKQVRPAAIILAPADLPCEPHEGLYDCKTGQDEGRLPEVRWGITCFCGQPEPVIRRKKTAFALMKHSHEAFTFGSRRKRGHAYHFR